MIVIKLPPKKQETSYGYSPKSNISTFVQPKKETSNAVGEMFKEAKRRDDIIKDLCSKLPYKEGDIVVPCDAKELDKIGECKVTNICRSYANFGKSEKWPSNDLPMIITIYSEKSDSVFWCTPNYVKLAK